MDGTRRGLAFVSGEGNRSFDRKIGVVSGSRREERIGRRERFENGGRRRTIERHVDVGSVFSWQWQWSNTKIRETKFRIFF